MDNTHTTTQGTPWAATWDESWAVLVEQKETQLGRRTCGAKTFAGTPCPLTSDHPTGRCAHHGGTDAIGAPIGNSNARIHGLYARRLQRCGTHCPMWEHCPFAKPEILALDPPERPNCAYETAEYDAIIESLSSDAQLGGPSSTLAEFREDIPAKVELGPPYIANGFRIHNLALLQVMVSRAAAALSVTTLTDTVTSESDRYRLQSTKVHAALEAFLRLSREHRATLAQYTRDLEQTRKAEAEAVTEEPPTFYVRRWREESEDYTNETDEDEEQIDQPTRRTEWPTKDDVSPERRQHESASEFEVPTAPSPEHPPRPWYEDSMDDEPPP